MLAESGAVEAFNVYITESGGITRAREIAAIANTAGIACVFGTWGEGGFGQAAVLHVVASSRNFEHASDSAYPLTADCYLTEPFLMDEQACLAVPRKPGLASSRTRQKSRNSRRSRARTTSLLPTPASFPVRG